MKIKTICSQCFFALIIILFANTSCNKVPESIFNEIILIDFSDELVHNASELFENVSYLQLNTGSDMPLGEISSLKIFDNILVVFDESQESLFLFDDNGVLLNSVNSIGKGPGEYLSISDYNIINDELYVITNRSNIDKFSLKGRFIERVGSSPHFIDQFQVDKKDYIVLSKLNDDENRIFVFDKDFGLIDRKLPYKDDNVPLFNFWPELPMTKANDSVYFYLPEDYGIYSYSKEQIIPKFKYRFKGVSIDLDNLSANDINSNTLPVIRGFFFINDYLITQLTYKGIMYQHIYSLASKKSKLYNVFEINNDIDNLMLLWSLAYGASEKHLYSVIPFELFEDDTVRANFINEFSEDIDNSVIGVFSIKEF